MIRAVCFDLWDTLYRDVGDVHDRRVKERVRRVQSFMGAMDEYPEPALIRAGLRRVSEWIDVQRRQYCRGVTATDIGYQVGRQLGHRLDEKTSRVLGDLLSATGTEAPPQLIVGAAGVLENVAEHYAMALICDTGMVLGQTLREVMRADDVLDYFAHLTFSSDTMTTKPLERQFLYTLGQLGVRPDEAVHVGDSERRDVAGAKQVGLRAVLVGGNGEQASEADAVIERIEELPAVLEQWSRA